MWVLPKEWLNHSEPSVSAMDMAELNLESSQQGSQSEISLLVRSKPIALRSHLRKCKRDKWYLALCSQISSSWTLDPLRDSWIYSQGDFLANPSVTRETRSQTPTADICSQTSLGLLTSADQEGCSLKMSKESSQPKCKTVHQPCSMSLESFKAEVIEQRGVYSARLKSVSQANIQTGFTREKEFLSWPTPSARDYKGAVLPETLAAKKRNPMTNSLPDAVQHKSGRGHLNPAWVEWLMGLPIGWTELKR